MHRSVCVEARGQAWQQGWGWGLYPQNLLIIFEISSPNQVGCMQLSHRAAKRVT